MGIIRFINGIILLFLGEIGAIFINILYLIKMLLKIYYYNVIIIQFIIPSFWFLVKMYNILSFHCSCVVFL